MVHSSIHRGDGATLANNAHIIITWNNSLSYRPDKKMIVAACKAEAQMCEYTDMGRVTRRAFREEQRAGGQKMKGGLLERQSAESSWDRMVGLGSQARWHIAFVDLPEVHEIP